jgi:hypothetical protein
MRRSTGSVSELASPLPPKADVGNHGKDFIKLLGWAAGWGARLPSTPYQWLARQVGQRSFRLLALLNAARHCWIYILEPPPFPKT